MYPGIKRIARKCQNAAQVQGYVTYWTGRRRHFKKSRFNPKPAYYRAFNAWIQGGEAEIMKRAMITLQEEVCNEDARMVLQIHDEIAFEIHIGMAEEYLPRMQEVMERVPREFCAFTGVEVAFPTQAKRWGEK
jgi:DNA polymerase-1